MKSYQSFQLLGQIFSKKIYIWLSRQKISQFFARWKKSTLKNIFSFSQKRVLYFQKILFSHIFKKTIHLKPTWKWISSIPDDKSRSNIHTVTHYDEIVLIVFPFAWIYYVIIGFFKVAVFCRISANIWLRMQQNCFLNALYFLNSVDNRYLLLWGSLCRVKILGIEIRPLALRTKN